MPDFELTGPDGSKFQVTAPDEGSALSAFQQFNGGGEADKPAPVSANDVVRATATGVPIVGGMLNKANAATNAALAPLVEPFLEKGPDTLDQPTFGQRYAKSLELQNAKDIKFAKEHPVIDTTAKIAGGVGATIPAVMAAPAFFGASGTLPQMVARGAASGAGISAADAAVRGEDVIDNAAVGGAFGAGAPLLARGIGAAVRAVRPTPAPVPLRTVKVGTVEVPLTQSQVTGDAAQSAEEQILARGGRGEPAQKVAQDFEALQAERMGQASDEIAAGLDPTGASARTAPQAAGERVIDDLTQAELTRIATENSRRARIGGQGEQLRAQAGAPDLPDGLNFVAQPSRNIRANADPRAHEIQIVGDDGKPHYRMEITQEGDGLFGVGYVENLSREHSGLGARLYQEAAKYAESQGGRLIAGMNTNAKSAPILNRLVQTGAASPREIGGRQLFQIHPTGAVDSAFQGAEVTGTGVMRARDAAVARTRGLYKQVEQTPGTFDESVPRGLAEDIRARLNTGPEPLWVDPQSTSKANEAIKLIDETVGNGLFRNAAARAPVGPVAEAMAGATPKVAPTEAESVLRELLDKGINPAKARAAVADLPGGSNLSISAQNTLAKEVTETASAAMAPTAAPIGEVGLREMDSARKRLVVMYSDARKAAMGPGGSGSDARAMGRILHEFDNAIIDAFDAGRFSGDSEAAKALLKEARASHAQYRQTFTNRGGTDPVGRSVEKILGRYADTAATPDEIAKLSYGALGEPGGGEAMKVAQRLRSILGPTSPEWGAYKQGLVSHLIDVPEGVTRSPAATADRIDKFLTGTKGRGLAQVVLSADERAALKGYADNLRTTEPVPLSSLNTVEKAIARISGRDGGLPATPGEVVDLLYSRTGKGDKGISVGIAQQLKRDLSPEGWTAVRQGMWSKLTNAGEGKIEYGPQALSQRLHEFLNESGSSLSKVLFSDAERRQMAVLAKTYKQMIPVKGTTNPSGTAPMLAKIAKGASNNLLTMLGAMHSGFVGAGVGYGVQKGLSRVADSRGTKLAVESFYGSQPRAAIKSGRAPVIVLQGVAPQVGQ